MTKTLTPQQQAFAAEADAAIAALIAYRNAWLSGVDDVATCRTYEAAIARVGDFLGIEAELHDVQVEAAGDVFTAIEASAERVTA